LQSEAIRTGIDALADDAQPQIRARVEETPARF